MSKQSEMLVDFPPTVKSKSLNITVVLATHNGGERLRKTLESMTAFKSHERSWQVIVVNNNSTDHTQQILDGYENKLPLKILQCKSRGKNNALNAAIPHFDGDLILFTDDDVILPENWLSEYNQVAQANPEFSVFGGRIIPNWPSKPPKEILEGVALGDAFAIHEAGIPDGEVFYGKIWGPNMAVRSEIFKLGFRFNEKIGPSGGLYIPGSESAFNMMLHKHKFRFYFSNSIIVQHQIRPEQLTRKWLMRRAYIFGKGRAVWDQIDGNSTKVKKTGIFPRWFISYFLRSYLDLMSMRKAQRVKGMWNISIVCGMIRQTIHISNNKLTFVKWKEESRNEVRP
jgi:glycosyltransferase involved in cell wall biosynthesis